MAELNANLILAAGKPVEFPDPVQSFARVAGIQQLRQRMIDTQRDTQENDAIRQIMQQSGGQLDEDTLAKIRQVSVPKSLDIEKTYWGTQKARNEIRLSQLETQRSAAQFMGEQMAGVLDAPEDQRATAYQHAIAATNAIRHDLNLGPADVAPDYNEGLVKGYIKSGMTVQQRLQDERDERTAQAMLFNQKLALNRDARDEKRLNDQETRDIQAEKDRQTQIGISRANLAVAQGHLKLAQDAKQTAAIEYDKLTPADKAKVDAAMQNPEAYNRLTPTEQGRLMPALQARGFTAWGKIDQQTRAMASMAREIIPNIKRVREEASKINDLGLMGPVGSRWREFVSGQLHANELATDPESARLLGKFQTDIGLLRTATARAHGGARGGGSPQMLAHMVEIMGAQGDFPTFMGNMDALDQWMKGYAEMVPEQARPYQPEGTGGGGGGAARVNPYRKK